MKVIIITEGYQSTGYGHITRCLSLYQAFRQKGITPQFFINGDEGAKSFLAEAEFILMDWLSNPTDLYGFASNSDIIIVDSYKAGEEFYSELYSRTKLLTALDDYIRLEYTAHVVINGTLGSENYPYVKREGTKYLLGGEYIPLRQDFWNVPEKQISEKVEKILITFGGQDVRDLTGPVLDNLMLKYPALKYFVVAKKNFQIDFNKYSSTDNVTFIYDADAKQMKDLMLECDIAITAAGQTLYELARTGLPSIAVIVADNQIGNLREWNKNGFIRNELFYNDTSLLSKISDEVKNLDNKALREKMSLLGRSTINGRGADKTIERLLEKIKPVIKTYFRQAVKEDAKLVFELSNDPVVRLNSINQNAIGWDDHLKWFNSKAEDKNYYFLLHFTEEEEFVGQVRFNVENDSSVISISIAENFRGKGLSANLLKVSCADFLSRFPAVKKIKAYIKNSNTASIQGFLKAEFKPAGTELIDGEQFNLYILTR